MEKKQTAVEWLIEKIEEQREGVETDLKTILYDCYEAKQMEKEQIIEAHGVRQIQGRENGLDFWQQVTGEQYYKEQYEREDN